MSIMVARSRPPAELHPSPDCFKLLAEFGRTKDVQWLYEDVKPSAQVVKDMVRDDVHLSQAQFDALTAFVYSEKNEYYHSIPNDMLAYLNGGWTKKGDKVGPCDFRGAMFQFPRYCRIAGSPDAERYRERLANACLFSGFPWQGACSRNLVTLAVTPAKDVDEWNSTSLEETLQRAMNDIPLQRPKIDLNTIRIEERPAPKPELILADPITLNDEIRAAPETSSPSSGPEPVGAATQAEQVPVPAAPLPESVASNAKEAAPAGAVTNPPAAPSVPQGKNPLKSQTYWGAAFVSMAPTFSDLGNTFLTLKAPPEVAGQMGTAMFSIGVVMIVLGRIGASQPINPTAPIRKQS